MTAETFSVRPWLDYDHSPFQGLPPACWSEQAYLLNELVGAVVDLRCLETLARLGVPAPSHLDLLADDLALGCGVDDERAHGFHWLFRRLWAAGLLVGDPSEEINDLEPSPFTAQALAQAVAEHGARAGTTFPLIEHVVEHLPAWLRGETTSARVLFSREALELWAGFFSNDNAVYAPVNRLAAWATGEALGDRTDLRIVEVGAGLGSAAEALLQALPPERIASYTFSDVAPAFLARGKRLLGERFPELPLELKRIDLDRPLQPQGLPEGEADLVYAVNTVHAVNDLEQALAELYALLEPGGVLVLGESVRRSAGKPLAIELVFQLTPAFEQVTPIPGLRERGGFLTAEAWPLLLRRAGFQDVELVPDLSAARGSYPGFAMAALVARR